MARIVSFHPAAVEEARQARLWYAERSPRAAERFMRMLAEGIGRIAENPRRWPVFLQGTRRYLLKGFPFQLVYR